MKKITNWKKFNEDIYPGWTSTVSNNPVFQGADRKEEPKKEAQPLPEKEFKLNLLCKIVVDRSIQNICPDVFNYGDIDDIVSKLEDKGFSPGWFADEIENFKRYNAPSDPGDEPDRDDFEDEDDYDAELESYETAKEEFDSWEDISDSETIERYVKENYNDNWTKFEESFTETGSPTDILSRRECIDLFYNLKELFNGNLFDNLTTGDVQLRNVLENVEVVGDDFVNNEYYELEITTNKEIDLDFYQDDLEPALIDEFTYGVGTELDEKTDDVSVFTWWDSGYGVDYGKFEIKVDKFKTYEFQKKFISDKPSEFERLAKHGYHKDIKKEYDHLFNAKDLGLM